MKRNAIGKRVGFVLAGFLTLSLTALSQTPAGPAADGKAETAQAAAAVKPPAGGWAFDVATIRPAEMPAPADMMSGKAHLGMKADAARVDIGFMSLTELISKAYKVESYQVSGPDWMGSMDERFDVLATMPEGATKEQVPEMLQALLAERFKLAVHHGTKEHSVYALIVGKGGPKMKEASVDPPAPAGAEISEVSPGEGAEAAPGKDANPQVKFHTNGDGSGTATVHGPEGNARMNYGPNGVHMEFEKATMADLAKTLTPFLDKPVIDMTEMKGKFQISLDLSVDDFKNMIRKAGAAMPGAAPAGSDANAVPSDAVSDPSGSIFKSVQELGLKLELRKTPLDQIIVDHIEKLPTEN